MASTSASVKSNTMDRFLS